MIRTQKKKLTLRGNVLYRWMFVCCGSHVKVYSYSSRRVVYTLAHHTKEVTGITLHPKKRMQVYSYPRLHSNTRLQ